ncbi:MAG: type II toxin-antitoxin system VapC family toxin [Saprospiraceae bacterium]
MTYLIDTQVLLWALEENTLLSKQAQSLLIDPANVLLVSTASLWELAIKVNIGKLALSQPLSEIIARLPEADLAILPIETKHILEVELLPLIHRDPFDRMIIAQAISEGLQIISSDGIFSQYPVIVQW